MARQIDRPLAPCNPTPTAECQESIQVPRIARKIALPVPFEMAQVIRCQVSNPVSLALHLAFPLYDRHRIHDADRARDSPRNSMLAAFRLEGHLKLIQCVFAAIHATVAAAPVTITDSTLSSRTAPFACIMISVRAWTSFRRSSMSRCRFSISICNPLNRGSSVRRSSIVVGQPFRRPPRTNQTGGASGVKIASIAVFAAAVDVAMFAKFARAGSSAAGSIPVTVPAVI